MYFIGIDLGTSSVKLLLCDEAGKIASIVTREYPLSFPHTGWSEQAPEDWWSNTVDGMHELLAGIDPAQVAGISFGGQMHGLVVLDKDDRVLRPAILWNDNRTVKENDYLNQVIGKERLSAYTGNISFTGFTAAKLLWMKANEPELFAQIDKIMLPKDYLAYRMTGVHSTDMSDASGFLLLDVKHRRWSQEMLDICGITEAQMPKLYESYEAVGTLTQEAAEALGLPENVIVAAGAGDNAAAAVGTGTVGQDACNLSLGTSGTIFLTSDRFRVDEHNALHSFCHADGHYHLMGVVLSAASCNKWFAEQIKEDEDFAAQQAKITDDMLGENHVFFLPYLMGERSPHNDPNARGTFIGMTMDTTYTDMLQAMLEGVIFAMRDSLEVARSLGIHPPRTKICGGGSKSPLWCRMVANIFNMKVDVLENVQGPSMGGALLAAVACGVYDSVEATASLAKIKETIEPEPALVEKYEARYQQFRKIYPALKDLFPQIQ